MINKITKSFFDKMEDLVLEGFIINQEGTLGTLAKQDRIRKCFKSIYTFVTTRENSIFTINNAERTLSVNLDTVTDDNDHVTMYLITIHENCETYRVDRVISNERSRKETIKNFELKDSNNE